MINKELFVKHIRDLRTLEDLQQFFVDLFKNGDVKVYLFGSRVQGNHSEFSDADPASVSKEDISEKITILKALLEESNPPFKID